MDDQDHKNIVITVRSGDKVFVKVGKLVFNIMVTKVKSKQIRLAFHAPLDVRVIREKIYTGDQCKIDASPADDLGLIEPT